MHDWGGLTDGRPNGPVREGGRKLLVVDDHDGVRESLGDLLGAVGFRVVLVDGGRSALDYLSVQQGTEAPDLILLDFALGDMTGADFLEEKAKWPAFAHIPVILLTADARAPGIAAAAGCECLGKPLELDELLAALERQTGDPRGPGRDETWTTHRSGAGGAHGHRRNDAREGGR